MLEGLPGLWWVRGERQEKAGLRGRQEFRFGPVIDVLAGGIIGGMEASGRQLAVGSWRVKRCGGRRSRFLSPSMWRAVKGTGGHVSEHAWLRLSDLPGERSASPKGSDIWMCQVSLASSYR